MGKVLKVIKQDKDVVSADASVQAIMEMWDGNQLILGTDPGLAGQVKANDVVLIDYNPVPGVSPPVPKMVAVKILRGKAGKDSWELFKKYKEEKSKLAEPKESPVLEIPYSR